MTSPTLPGDAGPVDGPLRDQLLDPFVAAVQLTLAEVAGVGVAVRSVYRTRMAEAPREFAAVVELRSASPRWLVLSFPMQTATNLTARILNGVTGAELEKLIGDCIGEIGNVVSGHAKTATGATPYRFTCSLPKVVTVSSAIPGHADGVDRLVAILNSEAGEIQLRIIMT
jgi:CheY-specific phosphatase CheX